MQPLTLILVLMNAGIILAEGVIWQFFRVRVSPLVFPHELDASYFRFFTMKRMRLVAILHTVILMIAASLLISLLW